MTVAELIARLQQFPPAATVGIKAACCAYTHHFQLEDVRQANPDEPRLEHTDVVIDDRVEHGTDSRGEKHGQHKLTEQDIVDITRLADSGASRAVIGRQYGIHPSTVRRIAKGQAWKHINPRSEKRSSGQSSSSPKTTSAA